MGAGDYLHFSFEFDSPVYLYMIIVLIAIQRHNFCRLYTRTLKQPKNVLFITCLLKGSTVCG